MDLALFDFDGTITHVDTFTKFMKYAVPKRKFVKGYLSLAPWIAGYRLGLVPGTQLRTKVVKLALQGEPLSHMTKMGREFSEAQIPGFVREIAFKKIQWHIERGDKVVVVSASLDLYLKPWCEKHGLDLICSNVESKGELLTGNYLKGDCTAKEKSSRVLEKFDLKKFGKVYAYGDTKEDRELLELADIKYFCWKEISVSKNL